MWWKKYWWPLLVLLIVLVSGVGYFWQGGREQLALSPSPVPGAGVSVSQLPTPPTRPQSTPNLAQTLFGPATCQLTGELKFLQHNIYNNQDAKFRYQGIDSPARNIFWRVTPKDDLTIGPNLFNQLPVPNGDSLLFVVLPDKPVSKRYELTASVQYGRVDSSGNIAVSVANCSGQTVVVLP